MGFTAGADVSTGDLITAAQWNNYMGVDGSIDYLYASHCWLDSSVNVVTDLNRTSSLGWTDLDLTASTSATARIAILSLKFTIDSISSGASAIMGVRKNGTTPSSLPLLIVSTINGNAASSTEAKVVLVGMDTEQIIEYYITIGGTIQVDSWIDVLGYID